ncbi:MAG TPA: D-alanine--D-alanine ligase [Erysipelotrichaceae bacterium]|nr:D-alanine--D-alanine ligase [Erysipelotrichaceae bacterium]
MKIGVFWRTNRNIELQKKISAEKIVDDAYEEAKMHQEGLIKAGYDAVLIQWEKDPIKMGGVMKSENIDLVFNASSYDEILFLETFNIPYSGSKSNIVGMDKVSRKIIASYYGVNTPKFQIAYSKEDIPRITLDYPLFVKPLNGRGSSGIDDSNIIAKYDQLFEVVKKITEGIGQPALIEEFIVGRELTVGIIGYSHPIVLPLLEIRYTYGRTNTFEHKMLDQEIITCPMLLPKDVEENVKRMALTAYNVLDIADYGRVDMMLDQNDVPYFLEVNTFAGLNLPDSSTPQTAHIGYMGYMAIQHGFDRALFLDTIVKSTMERYGMKTV